jgi:Fe-S cluster assembly protein SufD
MPTTTQAREKLGGYLDAYERLTGRRRGEPGWLQAARRRAITAFERRGFPTTRDEDWRFTNVSPIVEGGFTPFEGAAAPAADERASLAGTVLLTELTGPALFFVDGRYSPDLSRPADKAGGVTVSSLDAALRDTPGLLDAHLSRHAAVDDRPFAALNTALFEDGAFIRVPAGLVVDEAIQVVFLSTGGRRASSTQPRVLLVAEANSQVRLVEIFAGPTGARYLTNAVTEIVAADSAVVDHYRLQRESGLGFHVGQTQIEAGRASNVSSHVIAIGALIARHDAVAVLAGEGAECTLNGLYLARDLQLVDNHTEIDHAKPHGTSHQVYKGILDGKARGVFNGRIRVRPDAQKTDAKQTNKTLLIADEAQINTKPQLEIFANDVKCTHGATVGQLSQDALFYLRTRGIGAEDARGLLIRAFAMDVIDRIRLVPVRTELDRLLAAWLGGSEEVRA